MTKKVTVDFSNEEEIREENKKSKPVLSVKQATTICQGYISEINKAEIISKLTYIALCVSLLYCGMGLMSVVIANFIAPFVQRWYCRRVYFTEELVKKINIRIKKNEIKEAQI